MPKYFLKKYYFLFITKYFAKKDFMQELSLNAIFFFCNNSKMVYLRI